MKILIDENMPYAAELFGQLGEVITKPGARCQPMISLISTH